LSEGELFYLDARVDSLKPRIFISLFLKLSDSLGPYKEVTQNQLNSRKLSYRVEQTGRYKVLIQPELHAFSGFALRAYSQPLYSFPVLGEDNGAIQSFWGAPRSGGTRDHKGIDIFTNRGTPVVAVAEGRIGFAGERGLGGKQVWLRTGLLGNSLYYAHLDSIVGTSGKRVQVGDTLGFVGNTGNARTTSPHLHFGIYRGYRGAIDPLPYVFNKEIPDFPESPETGIPQTVGVKTSKANLRIAASLEGNKIGEAVMHDTLSVLGKTGKWLRILNSDGLKAYIHGSLVVEISDEAI
jgi:murein DD-endopeptidase MepM/ murein hydrolase activator NlpD